MKKYINKGILLVAIGGTVLFNSCESTLDVNQTEISATTDGVAPDLLLAGAISAPRASFEVTTGEMGSLFMNQWGGDINNVTGGFQDEYRLNFTQNYGLASATWNNLYRGSGTFQAIINFEDANYGNHKAISRIMKSFYVQYLVDIFGNVPYSQALQFGDNFTPAYDDAQTIYRDLIVQLDAAIATLNNSADYLPVGAEDTVFNGDSSSWIQAANTIKLRILLRQSELAGTDSATATYLNEQFAALDKNFLSTDATINPGFILGAGQQNPFWNNYGQDSDGIDTFDNDFITPSFYMAEFLKGADTDPDGGGTQTGVPDPRLTRLFAPSPTNGLVVGVPQGATNAQVASDIELSELGPGLLAAPSQNSYFISAAESFFLQAEAIERGYMTGNAQAMFESGITASFNLLGIPGSAAGYIAGSAGTNLIGWTGSANKIEAIMTQKWIALCGVNAVESWIDYTKTGFPDVPLPSIAEQTSRPNRMLYPASEFSTNSANVPNQPASEAFTTKIFWDVN
jgi:hypothetical protein